MGFLLKVFSLSKLLLALQEKSKRDWLIGYSVGHVVAVLSAVLFIRYLRVEGFSPFTYNTKCYLKITCENWEAPSAAAHCDKSLTETKHITTRKWIRCQHLFTIASGLFALSFFWHQVPVGKQSMNLIYTSRQPRYRSYRPHITINLHACYGSNTTQTISSSTNSAFMPP